MKSTVRVFVFSEGSWKAVRKPRGTRKPEWNHENEKTAWRIRRRQSAYDAMVSSPSFKGNRAVYHRPGSAS